MQFMSESAAIGNACSRYNGADPQVPADCSNG